LPVVIGWARIAAVIRTYLALAVALCAVGAPALARAETTAVVVAGDPGKKPAVVDAVAPWLQGKAQSVVLDSLPDADIEKLVDCFLTDDERCARGVVAAAGVDHLLFVMVQVNEEDLVQLTGSLYAGDGRPLASEHTQCPDCRVESLTRTAEQLVARLWRAVEPVAALKVTSTPAGATVEVDGKVVGLTPIEVDIDPGAHEIRVALAGYAPATRSVAPVAGSTQEVTVELERGGGGGGRGGGILPWIVIGAGAAVMITGGVLVGIDEDAPPLDPNGPEKKRYFDSALGGVSLLAVGAAAVGGGVYLYLRGQSREREGVVVSPTAGGAAVGYRGRF
jgi:hypothetical protein